MSPPPRRLPRRHGCAKIRFRREASAATQIGTGCSPPIADLTPGAGIDPKGVQQLALSRSWRCFGGEAQAFDAQRIVFGPYPGRALLGDTLILAP
jgi:hypothetical protein